MPGPKRYGFVKGGIRLTLVDEKNQVIEEGGLVLGKGGRIFIHLVWDPLQETYSYMGRSFMYPSNIPLLYRQHEFTELYSNSSYRNDPQFDYTLFRNRHRRLRILELFCGAGGSARGLLRASHYAQIVGWDLNPQPEYPFEFHQGNVLEIDPIYISNFDIVFAYPPCQAFTPATAQHRNRKKNPITYPNLISPLRNLLVKAQVPYVIENVKKAPIRKDLMLCGQMFTGLNIFRHRFFEISGFTVPQPIHPSHKGKKTIHSGGEVECVYGKRGPIGVRGHARWQKAMRMGPWDSLYIMGTRDIGVYKYSGLAEAIPPDYTEYILNAFLGYPSASFLQTPLQMRLNPSY